VDFPVVGPIIRWHLGSLDLYLALLGLHFLPYYVIKTPQLEQSLYESITCLDQAGTTSSTGALVVDSGREKLGVAVPPTKAFTSTLSPGPGMG